MRRLGVLLLVTALLGLGLAACSDDEDGGSASEDSQAAEPTGPPLEVTLELASDEVPTASIVDGAVQAPSVEGTVHVRNTTDGAIWFATGGDEGSEPSDQCASKVAAGISLPSPSEVELAQRTAIFTADCQPPEEIPPGEELTFDVTLSPTGTASTGEVYGYDPGEYVAWTVISPELDFAPLPDPTPIAVTAG